MNSYLKKYNKSKENINREYAQVNANPIARGIIQASVVAIDILIMFLIIWNILNVFIPFGSWINLVDGVSMSPTLNNGQMMFSEMGSFNRGDIVTTSAPAQIEDRIHGDEKFTLIKRIVGMPGDRLVIEKDGVYINGEKYYEDYLTDEARAATYMEDGINSVKLGADEYFIMGDNRGESFDSREFGKVTFDNILYKQSEKPTQNFWLKTLFVIVVFALDMCLYVLIEFVLTECAYAIIYGKKAKKELERKKLNQNNKTNDIVISKGEN